MTTADAAARDSMSAERQAPAQPLRITVVYNNVPYTPELTTAWGFAAVVKTGRETVLFDTGGDGPTLLANMRHLGIDPKSIGAVVLSHIHGDHTGGLADLLAHRPNVTVYMPHSFPAVFRRAVERRGAHVENVGNARHLFANLYSTGEMGQGTDEQALIVDASAGLVTMTGCSHPGIVDVVNAARTFRDKDIHLLIGGFHLDEYSDRGLRATLHALRDLGVQKVAPSHCTGDRAIAQFLKQWGSDFVEGGCGAVIEIP